MTMAKRYMLPVTSPGEVMMYRMLVCCFFLIKKKVEGGYTSHLLPISVKLLLVNLLTQRNDAIVGGGGALIYKNQS